MFHCGAGAAVFEGLVGAGGAPERHIEPTDTMDHEEAWHEEGMSTSFKYP